MKQIVCLGDKYTYSYILAKLIKKNDTKIKSIKSLENLELKNNMLIPIYNSSTGVITLTNYFRQKYMKHCYRIYKFKIEHCFLKFGDNSSIYVQSEIAKQCANFLKTKKNIILVESTTIAINKAKTNKAYAIASEFNQKTKIIQKGIQDQANNYTFFGLYKQKELNQKYYFDIHKNITNKKCKNYISKVEKGEIIEL